MNKNRVTVKLASLTLLGSMLSIPSAALAAGHITVGSNWAQNGGTTSVGPNAAFAAHLEAGRSYTCTALGQASDSKLAFNPVVTGPSGADPITFLRGNVTPVVTVSGSHTQCKNEKTRH